MSAKPATRAHDPLIKAIIDKLPRPGQPWSLEQRVGWLNMMKIGFDQAYGDAGPIAVVCGDGAAVTPAPAAAGVSAFPRPRLMPPPAAPVRWHIDRDGLARRPDGQRIMPNEIPVEEVLFDHRGEHGDLDAITWADDSRGVLGIQIDVAAA